MSTHQHISGLPVSALERDAPRVEPFAARHRPGRSLRSPFIDAVAAVATSVATALGVGADPTLAVILLTMALGFPIGIAAAGRYRRADVAIGPRRLDDLPSAVVVISVLAWAGALAESLAGSPEVAPRAIAIWWGAALGAFVVGRLALSPWRGVERLVIVGAGTTGRAIAASLQADARNRIDVRGFIDDTPPNEPGATILGGSDDLEAVLATHGIDRVLFAFGPHADERLIPLVRTCTAMGVQVDVVPRLFEVAAHRPVSSLVNGVPIESMPSVQPSSIALATKRAMDVVFASLALVLLAPLALTIAALIALTDRGPVFYSQPRVGRGGSTFRMLKFRTMRVGSDLLVRRPGTVDPDALKLAHDPRITSVGRMLRRTSLDELPQLLNVLRGDMSLVGPRPLPLYEAVGIPSWASARHELRPGLTGLWQVLGRSEIPFDERMRLDWIYVRQWSLGADLRLLGRTFGAVVSGRGAY